MIKIGFFVSILLLFVGVALAALVLGDAFSGTPETYVINPETGEGRMMPTNCLSLVDYIEEVAGFVEFAGMREIEPIQPDATFECEGQIVFSSEPGLHRGNIYIQKFYRVDMTPGDGWNQKMNPFGTGYVFGYKCHTCEGE